MKSSLVVTFSTLGCKLNQAETEQLAYQFDNAGYRISDGTADIYILNTCTVTHVADRKSRHLVKLFRKRNPRALIITTGCYAERAPQELIDAGADIVVDNKRKLKMLEIIDNKLKKPMVQRPVQVLEDKLGRVRSFVKIQDGCSSGCTYCIVPNVREKESCLAVGEIVDAIQNKCAAGYKEVILTGTKVGSYWYDGIDLKVLIKKILDHTSIERIHVSSMQPQEISSELLKLWENSRLIRHFHLALQSGCDSVLKRMNRRYTTADYQLALSNIREFIPDVSITTDIIVGFPGESNDEFEKSYRFCDDAGFAAMHIFVYSPRPDTPAAIMQEQVDNKIKKERSLRMHELSKSNAELFASGFIDREMKVLWEGEVNVGSKVYSGFTDNYIRVFTKSHKYLVNEVIPVRLTRICTDGFWGELIN